MVHASAIAKLRCLGASRGVGKPVWTVSVLRVKPSGGSCIRNVREYGCGALNVDETRIFMTRSDKKLLREKSSKNPKPVTSPFYGQCAIGLATGPHARGRWPANLLLLHAPLCVILPIHGSQKCADSCTVAGVDRQSGKSTSGFVPPRQKATPFSSSGTWETEGRTLRKSVVLASLQYGNGGGASRFFKQFTWKASACRFVE